MPPVFMKARARFEHVGGWRFGLFLLKKNRPPCVNGKEL
jgi:hypothetical protein